MSRCRRGGAQWRTRDRRPRGFAFLFRVFSRPEKQADEKAGGEKKKKKKKGKAKAPPRLVSRPEIEVWEMPGDFFFFFFAQRMRAPSRAAARVECLEVLLPAMQGEARWAGLDRRARALIRRVVVVVVVVVVSIVAVLRVVVRCVVGVELFVCLSKLSETQTRGKVCPEKRKVGCGGT
jgi:hypothetical protein